MGIAEELEKLTQLHQSGALSDREYAEAKQAVLRGATTDKTTDSETSGLVRGLLGDRKATLGEAANRYVSFQMVTGAISLVVFLLFLFIFFLPRWNSFP